MVALTYRYSDAAHAEFLTRRAGELHFTLAPARGSRLRSEAAIAEGVSAVAPTYGFDGGSRLRSAAAVAAGLNPRDPYALYDPSMYTPQAAELVTSPIPGISDDMFTGLLVGALFGVLVGYIVGR